MTPPLSPARPPTPAAPVVLFLTGPAGCGKTTLAEAWVRHQIGLGQPWTLLDKDLVGGLHGQRLLELLGADPHDRDSPLFKKEVRHLDYGATLQLAAAQLALGGSVSLPGPWTQELVEGLLADPVRIGLPPVPSVVAWLSISDATRRQRIVERGHPLDAWKLAHWEFYSKGPRNGEPPPCRGPAPEVIAAELPLDQQIEALARLVGAARRAGDTAPLHGGCLAIRRAAASAAPPGAKPTMRGDGLLRREVLGPAGAGEQQPAGSEGGDTQQVALVHRAAPRRECATGPAPRL